jgi:glycerophosphoryl diester phosphodiesterase
MNTVVVLVLSLYILKYLYVRFIRFDEVFHCPVLQNLSYPVLGAHRGGAHEFGPENTMYNYRRCVNELKVGVLEIDLRLSVDGHIVLVHDGSLERTTNGTGAISEKTLEELKSVNAAVGYQELRETIPTLEEVLNEFTPSHVIFFFDIKDEKVVPYLPEIIERWKLNGRLIVGAVSPRTNALIRAIVPKSIPIAPDFKAVIILMFSYLFGLSWLVPTRHILMGSHISNLTKRIISPGLISDWKKRNMRIILFGEGLNDEETQRHCLNEGVDILLTDRPDILKELLRTK